MDSKSKGQATAATPAPQPEPQAAPPDGILPVSSLTNTSAPPSDAVARVMAEGHDRVTAEKILADKAASEPAAAPAPAKKPSLTERVKRVLSPGELPPEPSPATKLIISQGFSAEEAEGILAADIEGVLMNCDPQTRLVIVRTIASVLHKL
jgi:hypothetical protein